jgi:hypothetical protein
MGRRSRHHRRETQVPREKSGHAEHESAQTDQQGERAPNIARPELQISAAVISEYRTGQQKSGRREWWRIGLECATLLAVAGYGAVAFFQWKEMRRSNAAADDTIALTKRNIELSERPWLSADLRIIDPLKFDESSGNGSLGVEVSLKNMGRSIATNARVIEYLTADMVTPRNVGPTEDTACGPLRTENSLHLGNVLFPSESMRLTDKIYIRKADIDAAVKRVTALGQGVWNGRIMPGLITCIDYTFPSSPTHHQTRYFSMVGERVDDFSQTGAIFPTGVYKVQLWRFFYGQYAD